MQYKVGLYGGCFDPIHLGHVDCILQAANQCEELYIVLVVSTTVKQIDYRVRYRWLYQLTQHVGNVKILLLEDHCNEKSEYTPEVAKADCEHVRAMIGKPIDAVFCGSDYGKDSFWGACYPECHPESESAEKDIEYLKIKVEHGCEFLTTQMFFDNNILYNFIMRLLKAGVDVPVVPGIMPVTNEKQINCDIIYFEGISFAAHAAAGSPCMPPGTPPHSDPPAALRTSKHLV
mgnify:CR=1 FL=1